ncbi:MULTISPECIES: substrate-binding domain-containing protein [unclassified Streptomyces]|uniref:sugar ABC transporter substrate-binding protein n=1 Tax=unclassified Streptomyces TaxID=2593676 RepID=UPI00343314D0
MRRIAMFVAASTMTLSLAGCGMLDATGSSTSATPTKGNDITVGVLMPDTINTRYTNFDYPIMASKIAELTNKQGHVTYANAASSAPKQATQMQKMIDDKVDVIILDAVDAHAIASSVKKAKDAGIPVIAYDRLAEGPIDSYVSFDNELVGEVQARTLLEGLGSNVDTSNKVIMVNGSPTDPNAKQFKTGAMSELSGKVTIARSYDTKDWDPKIAEQEVAKAVAAIGKDNVAAVYSANDAMAGGIVQALKAAGVTNMPPITGQDADLDAIQRILAGEQYMTVYKPYPDEAEAAAEMAVYKVQGKDIQFDALTQDQVDSPTTKNIPSQLVQVNAVTKSKIKDTVVADGIYKVSQICTAAYKSACAAVGLK